MKYVDWSRSDIRVVLRDRYGNFYSRISSGSIDKITINPEENVTDRLVFEPTALQSELTLDLPIPGTEKTFEFFIPANFIERVRPASAATASTAPTKSAPGKPASTAPSTPEPYDPEKDPKVRSTIQSDYSESMAEINRRRLGKGSNEGMMFQRRETQKLVKRLATDHDLSEDQIKRIVGLKR